MPVRLFLLATAVMIPAAATSAADETRAKANSDQNEKICENVTQIGSRLSRKRVCATRAEWAERRLQDRKDAEYIQKGITTATCTAVKTNGASTC
ncbi:MAG TPA: hypothetical protein VFH89_15590 [Sphingomicrobium sp.]|nr:hypothetical protein [Sphingomicrobium sp.]